MSRWGVAALAVAAATVIAIGMIAIRLSDRSVEQSHDGSSGPAPAASPQRSSGSDPSRGIDPRAGRRGHGTGKRALRAQLRRLERSLERRDREVTRAEVYVTVSFRKPIPVRLTDRRRRTPLPRRLPESTVYSLYAEAHGTSHRVRTGNLDGARTRRVSGVPRRRLVVLGISLPVGDYRDVRRSLRRSLPVGRLDVGVAARHATYLPDARYGNRALRSWTRYYRRS